MAQKIFPRSLRSQKLLSQDSSFYGEKKYASIWAKSYELTSALLAFSQKNLLFKRMRRKNKIKGRGKHIKIPGFLATHLFVSKSLNLYKISPILFKFARLSFSHKYNPIKAVYKNRRIFKKPYVFRKKSVSTICFLGPTLFENHRNPCFTSAAYAAETPSALSFFEAERVLRCIRSRDAFGPPLQRS